MKRLIQKGFAAWRKEEGRSASTQVDYGAWWEMDGSKWRVAWLQDTGELYAVELGRSDRFILLGHFATKKEINQTMQHWFEGADLAALVRKFSAGQPGAR